ncbi:myosin-11-like isoform X3 [Rosa rugosa]|uniref:myosin-11-like isoform X3 n=1 Tax=Rosa rugosa TaxID=74645 RepID=UPI002B40A5F8|nr:myosin-11-like isoform X3 [Rosa rugosa]
MTMYYFLLKFGISLCSPSSMFSYSTACLLLRREYVKAGLAKLEHWCFETTDEYAGSAWMNSNAVCRFSLDELKHIRQVIGFLVTSKTQKDT